MATGWLEMPGRTGAEDFMGTFYAGGKRNYSYHYDRKMFTSMWTAYPLYADTVGGDFKETQWKVNPEVDPSMQIDVSGPYSVNIGSTDSEDYTSAKSYYARGHGIPDADRDGDADMLKQTYYWTNSTPQIHSGFNNGIWSSLEGAVRNEIPAGDTLYVVTGAAFQQKGTSIRSVTWIYPRGETGTGKSCPVPNFYWKALLKVKRNSAGAVTSASSIAFWLPHEDLRGKAYVDYAVSVARLQQMTGFDFFVNLPDNVESNAESNSDWLSFTNF